MGMDVTQTGTLRRYKQKPWNEICMDKKTEVTAKLVSEFPLLSFKNMNLVLYGKQMENMRKKAEFVTTYGRFRKNLSIFSFRGIKNVETRTDEPFLY